MTENLIRNIIIISIIILTCMLISGNSYATENSDITNTTRAYFLSEITEGYGNGDCILLENYDSKGNKIYGLIDAGRYINKKDNNENDSTSVKEFLKNHGVERLEFFVITHNHTDHNGDALTVLGKDNEDNYNFDIGTIYMKEFDIEWVTDGSKQNIYEDIIEIAVERNIKVVGVSYESLISAEISPNRSQDFINNTKDAKQELFESFNEENTKYKFGSSDIQIFNWEMFDETGKQYIAGVTTDTTREIVSNENNNSIALLLTQGNKKAFFSGDMNNLDENSTTGRVGDEDRIKDKVGKVDLLKLGHHGAQYSNTEDYINVLKPQYAVITNILGGAYKKTIDWLNENNVNYIYTTSDEYGVTATITENDVYLGFETPGVKIVNNTLYYIPENGKYNDYTKFNYTIEYQEENIQVSSWKELKDAIDNTKSKMKINDSDKVCTLPELVIHLKNGGNWTADNTIEIKQTDQIKLISSENVTILRGMELKNEPLFLLNGKLSIGTEEMTGEITLDGNKNNVEASSCLIQADSGVLKLYDNVTLCNNMNKVKSKTYLGSAIAYNAIGSAIYASNTIIDMYGGNIVKNSQDIECQYTLPKEIQNNFYFETRGVGLYITNNSILNMYGGEISNNEAQNHSTVKSNDSYSKVLSGGAVNQRSLGVGIYAVQSEINLSGGEILDNSVKNYSTTELVKPSDETTKTNIDSWNAQMYGIGIYTLNSNIKMNNNFLISDNYTEQYSKLILRENTSINNSVSTGVRGVQGYINNSDIIIDGAKILNGNFYEDDEHISIPNGESTDMVGGTQDFSIYGGGLYIGNNSKYNINNLNIDNCQSNYGGGLYIQHSDGTISNSSISKNSANYGGGLYAVSSNINISSSDISRNQSQYGGGIYIANAVSNTELNNVTITNNKATYASGRRNICLWKVKYFWK